MAAIAIYKCKTCGLPFEARVADRKRGWARFCSKSCKATKQEARTGQHRSYLERDDERDDSSHLNGLDDHDPNDD